LKEIKVKGSLHPEASFFFSIDYSFFDLTPQEAGLVIITTLRIAVT
jgi:hypothetical protein